VFFEGGKKSGKGNAQGVQAGDKLVALENALRVRQQAVRRSSSQKFRSQLDARAHLRRTRRITHHSRKLAEDGLGLRGRWFRNEWGNSSG